MPSKGLRVFFVFLDIRRIAKRRAKLLDPGKPSILAVCMVVNIQIRPEDLCGRSGRQIVRECVVRRVDRIVKICDEIPDLRPFGDILAWLCSAAVNAEDALCKGLVRRE